MQDRTALVGQIATLQGTVAAHVATLAERDKTISAMQAELTDLRAGRDQLTATIATLEAGAKTVSESVRDQMAQIGVPVADLPPAEPESASAKTLSRAEFDKLNDEQKNTFFREGGRLTE
jgi:septal ring factor EnvC (AmiA/AmiB activator)